MALGDPYITKAELKNYLGATGTSDDDLADASVETASRGVEKFCLRQFNQAGTASARKYHAENPCSAEVDDFHTDSGLVVATDEDGDGVFETTWSASDYELEPLDGIVDGVEGWPFWRIRAVGGRRFPCGRRARLQVTAEWGWATVPAPVRQGAMIAAAETFKMKDAPLGVAGFGDFGVVRVRANPVTAAKLAPYVRDPILVG